MPQTSPEHCCGIFVTDFRNRWICPRCGLVWAWDDHLIEWVPTTATAARNDGCEGDAK